MSRFILTSRLSMRRKLIVIIALTLAIGLGVTSFFSIRNNIENIKNAEQNKIDLLSDVIVAGIKNAMVTGNAPIVIGWLESIKKTNGLIELKDFRRDGVAAFIGNETRIDVNTWLQFDRFPLRHKPKVAPRYKTDRMVEFNQVVETAEVVSFDEEIEGEAVQTRLVPILKDQRCILCHGYEDHPVRSILQISISKTATLAAIERNITWAVLSAILVIFLIGVVMSLLINREVLLPIAEAMSHISNAADSQNEITSKQASSVHEITVTVEQLRASSKQVHEKAESLAAQSKEALSVAHQGQQAIGKSISEMSRIKKNVTDIAEDVLVLSENTNQIGAIINVVGDIANKTDMLAVNAAIEAAKAAEHGKGFAVVASEVRSLADQSKKAAEKIESLVQEIQNAVNSTVMTTEEGGRKVDSGVDYIRIAGETIDNAIETIHITVEAASEIAIASRQEFLANEQVATAMNQINEGMQDSAEATQISLEAILALQARIDRRDNLPPEMQDLRPSRDRRGKETHRSDPS